MPGACASCGFASHRRGDGPSPGVPAAGTAVLVAGGWWCSGHPCQKQPSTKMVSLRAGKMKSGIDPINLDWDVHPVRPASDIMAASRISVVRLPWERIALMIPDLRSAVIVSVIVRPPIPALASPSPRMLPSDEEESTCPGCSTR